jgi:hypothetical protein
VAELKVYLSENLNEKFRRMAMSVYGYGRGSLSKAAEEALERWCTERSEHSGADDLGQGPSVRKGLIEETGRRINPDERQRNSLETKAITEDNSSKPVESGH